MRSAPILSVVSALVAATHAVDPTVTSNPPGVTYVATLPTSGAVTGFLQFYAQSSGEGTNMEFAFSGLPDNGGPFTYHIHVNPVNATGDCASTGGHLDPYNIGDTPCDSDSPDTCQVGDLSGKFGTVESGAIASSFQDEFTSLVPDTPAFIGNRSLVIHAADKSRIACANFKLGAGEGHSSIGSGSGSGSGSASPTGSTGGTATNGTGNGGGTPTNVSPTVSPTGGAEMLTGSVLGLLGVLAVGAALL